jgi:hypothetical protein
MKSLFTFLKLCTIPVLFLLPMHSKGQTRGIVWEYQIITAVESVIPGGLGRSRLLLSDDGGVLEEYKMENFFSLIGINFKNIKANDLLVVQKFNELGEEGWELSQTVSGVYSKSDISVTDSKSGVGTSASGEGIFITRYIFRRQKNR